MSFRNVAIALVLLIVVVNKSLEEFDDIIIGENSEINKISFDNTSKMLHNLHHKDDEIKPFGD